MSDLLSHISDRTEDETRDNDFKAMCADRLPYDTTKVDDDDFSRVQTPKGEGAKDQPTKGVVFFILSTVLMSGNLYAAQALFAAAETAAIMQLTFLRGAVCSLMALLMVNRNAKSTLWDPVERKTIPSLIFRCLQGGISVYISFSSINFFNVSTVGIVCSLKPIIACLLGVTILGEHMTCKDVVCMSAVFIAVFLVIFGSGGSDSESQSNPLAMVALASQPFLLAGGDIAMRKMKKMPEQLCSVYQNLSLTLLASVYMLTTGLSFDFVGQLSREAWLYLTLSCSLTILTQLAKARAFKYSESARLQKFSFLPNVWQFSIDILLLSVAFSRMQLIGFALLVTFYACELTYNIIADRIAKNKEFECNDEGYTKL